MADRDHGNRRRSYEDDWRNQERTRSGEGGTARGYGQGMDEGHYRTRDEERYGRPMSRDDDMGRRDDDMGRSRATAGDPGRYRQQMDTWPSRWQREMGGGFEPREEYYARYADEGRAYGRDDEDMLGRETDEGRFYGAGTSDSANRGMRPSPLRGRGMDTGDRSSGGGRMGESSYGRGALGARSRFDPVRGYGNMGDERFGAGGPGSLGMQGGFGNMDMGGRDFEEMPRTGKGPKTYKRSDERIREEINDQLMRHRWADSSEVDVQVKDGEVTLMGTVPDRRTKREVEDVAECVLGVQEVQNLLRLRREEPMLGRGREEDGAPKAQAQGGLQQQQPNVKAQPGQPDNKNTRMS